MSRRLAYVLPRPDQPLARDMAGGQGFGTSEELLLPPLEGLYWCSVASEAGYDALLLDLSHPKHAEREGQIAGADVLIVEVQLPTFELDIREALRLREISGGRLLLRTFIAEQDLLRRALTVTGAELIIRSQNYLLLPDILEGKTRAGTMWSEDGEYREAEAIALHEPDTLPIPDRTLLGNDALYSYRYPLLPGGPVATVKTSWGCPFSCGYYCPYPLGEGKTAIMRSAENVVQELVTLSTFGLNRFLIRDATFTLSMKRVKQICEGILAKELQLEWWCETRVDLLDRELMQLMVQAGCVGVNVGIETGDPEFMANSLKTGLSEAGVTEFVEQAREAGLEFHLLHVLGLPGETRETIRNSFKFLDRLRPENLNFTFATPYPGTHYHRDAEEYGWVLGSGYEEFAANNMVAKSIFLEAEELQFAMDRIWRFVAAYREGREEDALQVLSEVDQWADEITWPYLTVAIPTYNRLEKLQRCIKHLEKQTLPAHCFELIVVNDGSTDGTQKWLEEIRDTLPFQLRVFSQANSGPARARNIAIEKAQGEIIIFTGDDIYMGPDTLKHHCAWHRSHPSDQGALVGLVEWAQGVRRSPFMKWLDQTSLQFGFHSARHGEEQGYGFFYTSNLSMKCDFLRQHGVFDENFKHAAWEDIELGFRLEMKGFKIFYSEHAIAWHDHVVEFDRFVERQRIVGQYAVYVLVRHGNYHERDPLLFRGILKALAFATKEGGNESEEEMFDRLLMKSYALGLREGFERYKDQLGGSPRDFEDFICNLYDEVLNRMLQSESKLGQLEELKAKVADLEAQTQEAGGLEETRRAAEHRHLPEVSAAPESRDENLPDMMARRNGA